MLYFGNDRFDNSGDAQQGFWFFQNKIGLGSNVVGGGNGFTSSGGTEFHRLGDVLLISDFSNGGAVSTITVYTWDPGCTKTVIPKSGPVGGVSCGDANLRFQASSDSANCNPVNPATAGFCGIVTPNNNTASAWPFLDKSGNTTYLQGEMYEGGVNLSSLNLGGECFASVASETRSSQSTTAVLKDFVLGSFGDCSSGITTTPQTGAGGAISADANSNGVPDLSIGTGSVTVRDHAVVTVSGVTTWTGSVAFSLCGPLALSPTTTNCVSGGVAIPFVAPANGNVSNASTSVNSQLTTLTSVGRYCWRATFTSGTTGVPNSTDPDPGNPPTVPASTSTTECFEVLPVRPTLTTQASASVAVGGTVSDTGTLSGLATQPGTNGINGGSINATNGAAAGGSITWTAYGPDNCTTVAMAATSRTVSGNGTYPKTAAPDSQAAVSFVPTALGTYTFVASYDGNSPNNLASTPVACADQPSNEKVTVTGTSSLTTAQDWLPNDTATVTGDATLNGTVTFQLYTGDNCGATSGAAVTGQLYTKSIVNGNKLGASVSTDNTTKVIKAADGSKWSWLVSYDDNVLSDPAPTCESTTITIVN
jgi:hypothetical protein